VVDVLEVVEPGLVGVVAVDVVLIAVPPPQAATTNNNATSRLI
jgi:hypothetical protein